MLAQAIRRERDRVRKISIAFILTALAVVAQNKVAPEKEAAMKADLAGQIDGMKKQAQVMVDTVFSYGELGFQEFETSKYLTAILEKGRLQGGTGRGRD